MREDYQNFTVPYHLPELFKIMLTCSHISAVVIDDYWFQFTLAVLYIFAALICPVRALGRKKVGNLMCLQLTCRFRRCICVHVAYSYYLSLLTFPICFFLLPFFILPSLLSLTFQNNDPLRFQAGGCRRRPNLGLVCLC